VVKIGPVYAEIMGQEFGPLKRGGVRYAFQPLNTPELLDRISPNVYMM